MPGIGWVKLHRKLKNWRWYKDQPTKALFLHLLLEAEWVGENRGQVVTTESELEKETGLSRQQIRTAMKHLQSTKEITKKVTNDITNKVTNKKTVITIENYSFYQGEEVEPNQEVNQQDEIELTNEQPTSNQSTIDIKNYEEVIKNIKNNNARAHVRHADGVSVLREKEVQDNLDQMKEKIKQVNMEFYSEYNEVDL